MKPRYFQEFLGYKIGPLIEERSSRGGLNEPYDLVK